MDRELVIVSDFLNFRGKKSFSVKKKVLRKSKFRHGVTVTHRVDASSIETRMPRADWPIRKMRALQNGVIFFWAVVFLAVKK